MSESKNPYKPGSARFKLWNRREADRRKKEAADKPKKSQRDEVQEEIDKRPGYFKRQHTDDSN